jgi:hypothetical protein
MLEMSGLTLAGIVAGYILGAFGAGVWSNWRRGKVRDGVAIQTAVLRSDSDHSTVPEIMVKMVPAVNGRLLEVSTKKSNPMHHGHFDWEHEMFIVEEGQTLSQAIAMVMIMKGLEK